ncbi:hypothetical protein ACFPFV_12380 [Salinicoccus siamensis]|uniref:hypothetical protein n=1 Tax=Salinicoccus siamensis TaxID=381830 RepID=UPI003617DFAD
MNPAVTLASPSPAHSHGPGHPLQDRQVLGGLLGGIIVWLHFMPHFKAEEYAMTKLDVFSTSPALPNYCRKLASEIIGTFILVMGCSSLEPMILYRRAQPADRRFPDHRNRAEFGRYDGLCNQSGA